MTGPAPAPTAFYRPAEVAALLHCSEWWVKEQARRRRIPYAWIGGSYLFTAEHVAEIVRRFEVRPVAGRDTPAEPVRVARSRPASPETDPAVCLRARAPRRLREVGTPKASAA
jgi:Helix-turn-helix domain